MKKNQLGFILLTLGVFIILFFSKVFQHGLFFDGTIYSSIARNIAIGKGNLWNPLFSETIYSSFYEHPPLFFGLEAVFMKIFNASFFSEKLFSFVMSAFVLVLIYLIWKFLNRKEAQKNLFWLPILFWIITPKNSWTFTNNLLETAVTVFSLAACFLLLRSTTQSNFKKSISILIAAVFLLLTFLTKGFPGLFPLIFFLLYAMVFRDVYSFKKGMLDSFLLLFITGLVFIVFIVLFPSALENVVIYIDTQVLHSLSGNSRVGSRWVIPQNLFNELIPILLIIVLFFIIFRKEVILVYRERKFMSKFGFLFLLVGFSASIPLMISPKLSSFYLVPSLPYFALAFGFILATFFMKITERMNGIARKISLFFGFTAIIIGAFLTLVNIDTIGRDRPLFDDLDAIAKIVGEDVIISLDKYYTEDWTTIAYFQRYKKISFDRSELREFILLRKGGTIPLGYERVKLDTKKFDLAKKD